MRPVYLDYNATTPLDPEVIAAIKPFIETEFGNPSCSHGYGIAPRRAVETARKQVADFLNCAPKEIIFTSGGTESNNHAIKGTARKMAARGKHLITSAIEHPAVLEVCRHLETEGFETTCLPVDETGRVRVADAEKAMRSDTVLISIMHANNETGVIQPIEEIADLARSRGIVMHTDAAQSVGKIPVDVKALKVHALSIAGHKLYAPKGIGALYTGDLPNLDPFCHGSGQEKGRRAGTENVIGIVGLGKACEIAGRDMDKNMAHMKRLRDRLYQGILSGLDRVRLNGHETLRVPNTLSLSFHGLEANRILEAIGLEVAAAAGAACHAGSVAVSHVLSEMNVPLDWAKGSIRFSVGRMTTDPEIDKTIQVVVEAVKSLRKI